jgi:hypothetical protein
MPVYIFAKCDINEARNSLFFKSLGVPLNSGCALPSDLLLFNLSESLMGRN